MKSFLIVISLLFVGLFTSSAQTFPNIPLPVGVMGFIQYDQLGTPVINGGVAAIYPVNGQYGLYMTSTALLTPQKEIDPITQKSFYAVTTAFRQGLHKDMFDTGRWSFLLGGDIGPSIGNSSSASTSFSVNLSSSIVVTPYYQLNPAISLVFPIRGVYIKNVGWNPELEFGVVINLSKLPKAKT